MKITFKIIIILNKLNNLLDRTVSNQYSTLSNYQLFPKKIEIINSSFLNNKINKSQIKLQIKYKKEKRKMKLKNKTLKIWKLRMLYYYSLKNKLAITGE